MDAVSWKSIRVRVSISISVGVDLEGR